MKLLTVSAKDMMAVEKRDENHVYRGIQVREIAEISQLRDPIRNLEKIQGRCLNLRQRKETVQGSDTVAPEPLRKSSLPFRLYAASEDLTREWQQETKLPY